MQYVRTYVYLLYWQVLAKHATLQEAVDEICAAMSKKKEDPVRESVTVRAVRTECSAMRSLQ